MLLIPLRHRVLLSAFACLSACLAPLSAALAQIDIVTERYDNSRLGANLHETELNAANVNVNTFGKLWSYPVSGSVYAQPLYVRNLNIPGQGTHNVLYVVTMNDWVYAFDADTSAQTPLLSLDLTTQVPGSTPVPIAGTGVGPINIVGNVGIESTPQIDLATNTMYLVARTLEPEGNCPTVHNGYSYCHRLHALDITTLEEKFGGPVVIQGSVPGTGNASVDGVLTFDARLQNQRASLAMASGRIFIAWSSHEDAFDYHGWIMSYDATTLQQTSIWCSTPNADSGGIWMSGRAPVVDAQHYIYYISGNGTYDEVDPPQVPVNYGESFLRFGSSDEVPLVDWFTPANHTQLDINDWDLGGSGPILIPGTDLIIGGGKSGELFMTHTSDMGHLENALGTNLVQKFSNNRAGHQADQIKGGPVYWNRDGGLGPWMYVWSDNCNYFNAYHFNGATFDLPPVSQSTMLSPCGQSGGVLTLSANGSETGSGIVWVSIPVSGDANAGINPGVLRAFDADDLGTEIWNSNQDEERDAMGNWPKFSPPTVVNGHVYMGSFPDDGLGTTRVSVYGLLGDPDFTMLAGPLSPSINPGGSVTYDVTVGSTQGYAGVVHLSVEGLPANTSAAFAANDFAAPGSTTVIVSTTASTPLGPRTLSIIGTSGSLTHAADVSLNVTDAIPGNGAIGIDFVGSATPMGIAESAGVEAKPNWNSLEGTSGSVTDLVDETATATAAAIDWSTEQVWNLGLPDTSGDFDMMNGYLDAVGAPTSVTVSGLPYDADGYTVYVYADGDNGNATRTGIYQLDDGVTAAATVQITDQAATNFNGIFVQGGNYARFIISGTGFTLTATPGASDDDLARAPLNAIQIVPGGDRIFANGFDG